MSDYADVGRPKEVVEIDSTPILPSAGPGSGLEAAAMIAALMPHLRGMKRPSDTALQTRAESIGDRLGRQIDRQGHSLAIWSFPVGGAAVEGPTVHLMEALAADFGFLSRSVLVVGVDGPRVHLRARVVDLLGIGIVERDGHYTLSPPSGRWAKSPDQAERWRAQQLGAAESKCMRTALQHALPAWYVDAGVAAAKAAINGVGAESLKGLSVGQAAEAAIRYWDKEHGVSLAQLEAHLGLSRPTWSLRELGRLRFVAAKIKDGVQTVQELFGGESVVMPEPEEVTAGEGLAGLAPEAAEAPAQSAPREPRRKQPKAQQAAVTVEMQPAESGVPE